VLCSQSSTALGWIWFRRSLPQRGTILLGQVKLLLHMRGLGDLVSAAEIAFFLHLGNTKNKATPGCCHPLDRRFPTIGTVEFPSPSDGGELASPPLRLRRVGAR